MRELYLATYSFAQQVTAPKEMVFQAKALGFQGLEFLQPLDKALAELLKSEDMKVISDPMGDCIADYKHIMETAAKHGCQAFILERDDQYAGTPLDCIREDAEALRRFW